MAGLLPGFVNLKDLVQERVVGNLIPVVNTAFETTLAVHNVNTDRIISLFCQKTTDYKIRYKSPVAAYLQKIDEFGRARAIKMAGHYDLAFPLLAAGTAFGDDRLTRVKMTVQEANDRLALM